MRKLLLVCALCAAVIPGAIVMLRPGSGAASAVTARSVQRPYAQMPASQLPLVSLEPASSTVRVGEVFTVTVMIANASDLAAFEFDLLYQPAVVEVITATLGTFLSRTGRYTMSAGPLIDNATGLSIFAGFSWGHEPGVSGQGDLAHVAMRALAPGTSSLALQDVQLTDPRATVLQAVSEHGSVTATDSLIRLYLPLAVKGAR